MNINKVTPITQARASKKFCERDAEIKQRAKDNQRVIKEERLIDELV